MRNRKLQMLCEGAILVALAQILSMLKLWEMPWGGSITLGMLPIFLFAVRWGTRWGLVAGFAYGLLQVMFDGGFAISWQSILGDYLVAFTVLGLAGLGRGREKGIFLGTVLGGAARFVVHWVVGATVWAMYMPDAFFGMTMTSPWLYSLLYNGFYMLIDTLLCLGDLCPPLPAHASVSHGRGLAENNGIIRRNRLRSLPQAVSCRERRLLLQVSVGGERLPGGGMPVPVLRGGESHLLSKAFAEVAGVAKAAGLRHLGHREIRGEQQVQGVLQPALGEVFHGRQAQDPAEAAQAGIPAPPGAPGPSGCGPSGFP